jgi:hypothetical protein
MSRPNFIRKDRPNKEVVREKQLTPVSRPIKDFFSIIDVNEDVELHDIKIAYKMKTINKRTKIHICNLNPEILLKAEKLLKNEKFNVTTHDGDVYECFFPDINSLDGAFYDACGEMSQEIFRYYRDIAWSAIRPGGFLSFTHSAAYRSGNIEWLDFPSDIEDSFIAWRHSLDINDTISIKMVKSLYHAFPTASIWTNFYKDGNKGTVMLAGRIDKSPTENYLGFRKAKVAFEIHNNNI